MTRNEQIGEAAMHEAYKHTIQEAYYCELYFEMGAKWADRTMIERACEWLERHTPSNYTSNTITFVELFRKAMEQ